MCKKTLYYIKAVAEQVIAQGPLAQLAEHLTFNQVVPRSNRGWLTIIEARWSIG